MPVVQIPKDDLKLQSKIGFGGFGTVYKALWKEKQVAAKRSNQTDPEKDHQEADMLSQLNHPNIVKMFGVVDDGIDFFLILELCDRGSLREYLNAHRGERLGLRFYDWAKQAARAIEYLKEKKIIHKDVKSANYLIANGNILKISRFWIG